MGRETDEAMEGEETGEGEGGSGEEGTSGCLGARAGEQAEGGEEPTNVKRILKLGSKCVCLLSFAEEERCTKSGPTVKDDQEFELDTHIRVHTQGRLNGQP